MDEKKCIKVSRGLGKEQYKVRLEIRKGVECQDPSKVGKVYRKWCPLSFRNTATGRITIMAGLWPRRSTHASLADLVKKFEPSYPFFPPDVECDGIPVGMEALNFYGLRTNDWFKVSETSRRYLEFIHYYEESGKCDEVLYALYETSMETCSKIYLLTVGYTKVRYFSRNILIEIENVQSSHLKKKI